MTDLIVTPEVTPVEPVADQTQVVADTTQYFGTDGALNEGWTSTLPEDIRDEKSLTSFKTIQDLAKSNVMTKKMVGKNTMVVPSETSTESEWEEYHKAGGRPDTSADYGLAAPKDFPPEFADEIFPADRIAKWQERFFKGGISKKAADNILLEFGNDMLADIQSAQQAQETQNAELLGALSTEWGAAMEQNKHLGNIAVEEGTLGDIDFKTRLTEKFGNDPDFIRYSFNLGNKFSEGKSPNLTNVPTPADHQDAIYALMADPLYTSGTAPQRMKIANKIMAIRKLQKPEPVTT